MPRAGRPFVSPLSLPVARDAPRALVAQLRAIDPTLELVHMGDDAWMVGAMRPTQQSVAIGQRMLAGMKEIDAHREGGASGRNRQTQRLAELALLGFRPIARYEVQGEPTSDIVRDVERRDWTARHDAEADFERRLAHAAGDDRKAARIQALRDKVLGDGALIHAVAFKKRVSVSAATAAAPAGVRHIDRRAAAVA